MKKRKNTITYLAYLLLFTFTSLNLTAIETQPSSKEVMKNDAPCPEESNFYDCSRFEKSQRSYFCSKNKKLVNKVIKKICLKKRKKKMKKKKKS